MSDGHPLISEADRRAYHDNLNQLAPLLKRCSDGLKAILANSLKCGSNAHTALEASLGRKLPHKITPNAKLHQLLSALQQYARMAASARVRNMNEAETRRHHKSLEALAAVSKENADAIEGLAATFKEVHLHLQKMHEIFDRYP